MNGVKSISVAVDNAKDYLRYKFSKSSNAWFKTKMDSYIPACGGYDTELEGIERALNEKSNSLKGSEDADSAELKIYEHTANFIAC